MGKIHKNVIRPGLGPAPCWEAYSTHPDTTAGLREPTPKGTVRGE